ncbi:hypothetical protein [Archangium lansingense]|uniref:Transmembrane protein n=1 Tax=Archangium lansingense TaxID=2995310 RepID=A0ABT4A687_9BACT|nr:hypothetical protein [Archangium lansinium]MCY1076774.1 hypothetical protein [Archangium lansinium]
MNTPAAQWLAASSLSLLLLSCSATGYVPPGPSGSADLSRYVLIIQEVPDGQVSHSWQPISGFDLSKYPYLTSHGRLEAPIIRASFNRDCEAERDRCEEMCKASLKGRHWTHASAGSKDAMCRERCMPAYQDCCRLREMAEAGKLRVGFAVVGSAIDWLKQHNRELLVGSVVVIAGVVFVVVSSAGGILLLAPAVLLASSSVSSNSIARVEP